jgi:hypothetical protein
MANSCRNIFRVYLWGYDSSVLSMTCYFINECRIHPYIDKNLDLIVKHDIKNITSLHMFDEWK